MTSNESNIIANEVEMDTFGLASGGEDKVENKDKPMEEGDDSEIKDKTAGEVQVESGEEKPQLNGSKKYVVVGHFLMPGVVWDDEVTGISWVGLPATDIRSVTDYIKTLLSTSTPTNIVIFVYQTFIGSIDVQVIEKHLNELVQAAANSGIHQVVFPTMYHVPIQEKSWPKVLAINQVIRLLTLDCGRPPLNLHKMFLKNLAKGKVQYIRAELWAEFTNKQGVGSTPSWEGLKVVKNGILKYCYSGGFEDLARPMSKCMAPDMTPPPLCFTYEYKHSEEMMYFIEKEGLRVPARPTGAGNKGATNVASRPTARQQKNKPFKTPPPPTPSSSRRTSVSSAKGIGWKTKDDVERQDTSDDELTEDERRTKRFLAEKGRKRSPSVSTEDLPAQLEKLRVDGIKQSKRSRIKYERFEDEIKDLKRQLRKMDENEILMKDDLKEKDKKIKKLKTDLAKADVDADEWQDAYESLRDECDKNKDGGNRRRRY